jgi:hypothetical protein
VERFLRRLSFSLAHPIEEITPKFATDIPIFSHDLSDEHQGTLK